MLSFALRGVSMRIVYLYIILALVLISEAFLIVNSRLHAKGLYERSAVLKRCQPYLEVVGFPAMLIGVAEIRLLYFASQRTSSYIVKHRWSLMILLVLLSLSVTSFVYLHHEYGHPIRQSVAANVGTDAFFAIVTIFAIGRIDAFRRSADDKRANEFVYSDLKLALRKVMLRLLIELGHEEKESAIRTNITYLQEDDSIFGAFWRLGEDTERLNEFICGFQGRTPKDIRRMVKIKKIVNEGLVHITHLSSKIRPAPINVDILGTYKYWEIEDLKDYDNYLKHGKIYGPYFLFSPDDPSRIKSGVGLHTVEWADILGEYRSWLAKSMKYIADIYERCHDREL